MLMGWVLSSIVASRLLLRVSYRSLVITGMAIFLASAESDYIVSQCYNVDGGQWMS